MIEAIVFDFDGLILDTETPEFDAWQEIFHSYGVKLERQTWELQIGRGHAAFDIYKHLAELCGQHIDRQVVRPRMRRRYLELIDLNPVLPGVEDYISAAKNLGMKIAIASSSRGGWASGHLERRNLLHHFEFVLSAEDVREPKPDPELYRMAVGRLGVEPRNALSIEDSAVGLSSAKAAGLNCVVVPNPMTKSMDFSSADLRLESLAHMPLEILLRKLEHTWNHQRKDGLPNAKV